MQHLPSHLARDKNVSRRKEDFAIGAVIAAGQSVIADYHSNEINEWPTVTVGHSRPQEAAHGTLTSR
jgi:hypothetical protein